MKQDGKSVQSQEPKAQFTISPQDLRHALDSLYANVDLAGSTLAATLPQVSSKTTLIQRAQALRNVLLDVIEALRPLRSAAHTDGAERSYEVMSLRYVSGYSVEEIAERLSLSERQIYRDLRRGEDNLLQILQAEHTSDLSDALPDSTSALQEEIDVLVERPQPLDLHEHLHGALSMIRPLADQKDVALDIETGSEEVWAMALPGVLKEVLIQTLSAAVQRCRRGQRLRIRLGGQDDQIEIRILTSAFDHSPEDQLLQNSLRTARSLGFGAELIQNNGRNTHEMVLSVNSAQPLPVLIIEDNPGACELYHRYLQGTAWRAVPTTDPTTAVNAVLSTRPAAIILDLLMPDMDGWSVLQALKLRAESTAIPVIICSAISDPELATVLGASASLDKPLSRLELLGVLQRLTGAHTGV